MKLSRPYQLWAMFIVLLLLPALACGGLFGGEAEPPAEPLVETVVVVATPTPVPEPEPEPEEEAAAEDVPELEVPAASPGQPTVTALVSLNVRRGPGTNYEVVGALREGNSALILGSNPSRTWWKIECPGGMTECWVSAGHQFSTAENVADVPVAAVPPPPPSPTPVAVAEGHTPTATYPPATATYAAASTATAIATNPAAATEEAQTTPTPTYTSTPPAGPTATATPTGQAAPPTSTPTSQATPTSTYTPTPDGPPIAPFDGDSIQNPAVFVNFRPTGDRVLIYSNDISQPEGDFEDWVAFNTVASQSPTTRIWISVECNGYDEASEDRLRVTLWDGFEEQITMTARCGDVRRQFNLKPNHDYSARIHFQAGGPYYAQYTVTIDSRLNP